MPADLTPVLTSTSAAFTVTAGPAIDSVVPSLAQSESPQLTITVNGVGFDSSAEVYWEMQQLTTTYVSATQLTAVVPTHLMATAGQAGITVHDGSAQSNVVNFTVASGPTIGSLSPNLLQAGMAASAEFGMTVTGGGFAPGAIVNWNDIPLYTEFVGPTSLIATVPANFAFAPGSADVTVTSGGSTSNGLPFTLSPGATIVSLSPDLAVAGSAGFVVTVNGV